METIILGWSIDEGRCDVTFDHVPVLIKYQVSRGSAVNRFPCYNLEGHLMFDSQLQKQFPLSSQRAERAARTVSSCSDTEEQQCQLVFINWIYHTDQRSD